MPSSSGVGADAVRQALAQQAATPRQAPAPRNREADDDGKKDVVPKGKAAREPADVARPPARGFADAQASSVARGVPSVREAKELRAAEETAKNEEARVWFQKGISATEAGNPGAARVYYRMAARRATGDLKREILERLEGLHPSDSSRP